MNPNGTKYRVRQKTKFPNSVTMGGANVIPRREWVLNENLQGDDRT